jgi:Fe-S cluster assembly protein SufD
MSTIGYIEKYYDQLQAGKAGTPLANIRKGAFADLNKMGIPGSRHEEWKYTRIGSLFNREYQLASVQNTEQLNATDINNLRLPGSAQANELVFINGKFSLELSSIRTAGLVVLSLEEALNGEYKDIVSANFGHSAQYLKDGINALSTALVSGALFVHVRKGKMMKHPIYIYNITDARFGNILSQPRSLVHIGEQAQVQIVENFITVGKQDSITNHVIEIAAEKDSITDYYKIQNDASNANLVSTTHVRQLGKSIAHTVTITLNGGMVRNNLNLVMEADHCEAHLYGLYFQQGNTHVDNHTVVDNVKPHCYSNELYKGILKDNATGVFNGKIFVRPQAQKTNAYQSNKNILLSDLASVNTKPQLEIFADDVKCSHGCTVGQLDEEALFYLRSRGIQEETATSMLLHGFAIDVLEKIKLDPIRAYVDRLIDERLEFETI